MYNAKDIAKETAKKLEVNVEMVEELMSVYYKEIANKLSSCDHLHVRVPGLGTFSMQKGRVSKKIERQLKLVDRLNSQNVNTLTRYEAREDSHKDLKTLYKAEADLKEEADLRKNHRKKRYEK